MHHALTLLSPSAALPGLLSRAYTAESQLARFERLREKPGALTATEPALSAAEAHFRAQVSQSFALLDNMELCDTPSIGTFKAEQRTERAESGRYAFAVKLIGMGTTPSDPYL